MNQDIESIELRENYDFSKGVRGKHHQAYRESTNIILLEPDVAKAFPNDESVNKALRYLLEIAETSNRLMVHIKP